MYTIKLRRDTAVRWARINPKLADGEPGYERNTGRFKIGDGSTLWNDLPYFIAGDLEGIMGPPGPAGPQGPAGADGADGPEGPQGLQGVPGVQGPAGVNGAQGPSGPAGVAGTDGRSFNYQGAWASDVDYVIDDVVSHEGSSWIAITTSTNSEPTLVSSDWDEIAIAGAQGVPGNDGAQGVQGPQGEPGDEGPQGVQGIQGIQGIQGVPGLQGDPGPQGIQGPAGIPILSRVTSFSEAEQPANAVEWRIGGSGGALLAKVVAINPIENSVIANRSEVRLRVKSRDGLSSQERLLLDSDGKSDSPIVPMVTALPTTGPGGGALVDGQECYLLPDPANFAGVAWHLKYRADETGPYKWYRVGGSELLIGPIGNGPDNSQAADQTASIAFTNLGVVGPTLTVPLAGEYLLDYGFHGNAGDYTLASPAIGAAAAQLVDATWAQSGGWNGTTRRVKKILAAGATITLKYRVWSAVNGSFSSRRMSLIPLHVG